MVAQVVAAMEEPVEQGLLVPNTKLGFQKLKSNMKLNKEIKRHGTLLTRRWRLYTTRIVYRYWTPWLKKQRVSEEQY